MIAIRKAGLLEAINCVAGVAATSVRTLEKLSIVRIGFVAIRARIMGNGRFEVCAAVAGFTLHLLMFALQRKLRFGMIEVCDEGCLLPTPGAMARFTRLVE